MSNPSDKASTYRAAGVDLEAGERALSLMRGAVERTYTPAVLAGIGAFGGLYHLAASSLGHDPVLVASTDGVGTKTSVAAALERYGGVGGDIVNHCLNDILVGGAKPLFFLDYVAASTLQPEVVAEVVTGVAEACREAGAALLGGETAEMPGVYEAGAFDLVGTMIGVVEREKIITGARVRVGDQILGLASGGLQTNGFSLARRVLAGRYHEPLGEGSVGDALLAPHRSFLGVVRPLLDADLVRGTAHVTGGGLPGNLPRVLPAGLGARVRRGNWPVPEIFTLIQERGAVSDEEMFSVFNMGVGFALIIAPEDVGAVQQLVSEPLYPIGEVVMGEGVRFV